MTRLHVSRTPGCLGLGEAVRTAFGDPAGVLGLSQAPEAVALGPVLGDWSGLAGCPGKSGDRLFSRAFEAVCFSTAGTLRWHGEIGGVGHAVFVSTCGHVPEGWQSEPVPGDLQPIRSRQVLWGRASAKAPAEGWSRLVEARIGHIDVPLEVPEGQGVALVQTGYFSSDDTDPTAEGSGQDGNPWLVAQVMNGLKVIERRKPRQPREGHA